MTLYHLKPPSLWVPDKKKKEEKEIDVAALLLKDEAIDDDFTLKQKSMRQRLKDMAQKKANKGLLAANQAKAINMPQNLVTHLPFSMFSQSVCCFGHTFISQVQGSSAPLSS